MARSPIMCRKERGGFFPADAWAQAQYDAIPDGKELSVRVSVMSARGKTEREGARGWWWAGLEVLAINTENPAYDSKRKAHDNILTQLGYVRPRIRVDGSVDYIPISTAEDALEDEEFLLIFERARAFVVNKFQFDPWDMWKQEQDAMKANRQRARR